MTTTEPSRPGSPDMRQGNGWLIYGAYGYTGRLILGEALRRGHRPTVAGRDPTALREVATTHDLPALAFDLDDRRALGRALFDHAAVVNAAGPFSSTWEPIARTCLETGCHYLDITGEIEVLEAIHTLAPEASAAGIHMIPGTGFDVVPTDCAAALVAAACPGATRLDLAFAASGGPSRGTARTALEHLARPGAVRREGRIVSVPPWSVTRTIPFSTGDREGVAIAWGDVSTAWHSTGVPHVRVFFPLSRRVARTMRLAASLLRLPPVRKLARWAVDGWVTGPDAEELTGGWARVWAEARDAQGHAADMELLTPNGYSFTAGATVRALERVLRGELATRPGTHTPSRAFGAEFVFDVEGVRRIGTSDPPASAHEDPE